MPFLAEVAKDEELRQILFKTLEIGERISNQVDEDTINQEEIKQLNMLSREEFKLSQEEIEF